MMWIGNEAPEKWMLCDGTQISITTFDTAPSDEHFTVQYQGRTVYITTDPKYFKLVNLLKNITALNPINQIVPNHSVKLPDFRNRFPLGASGSSWVCGNETYNTSIGSIGGTNAHTLTVSEIPAHSHKINVCTSHSGDKVTNSMIDVDDYNYPSSAEDGTVNTDLSGGGTAHNNIPPYFAVNFIIKAEE